MSDLPATADLSTDRRSRVMREERNNLLVVLQYHEPPSGDIQGATGVV